MTLRKNRKWPWMVGLLALVGTGVALLRSGTAGPAPLDPALVVAVQRGTLALEIQETGRVEAKDRVELKSKVAGQALEVRVEEGARVKKGDLLLLLDPSDYAREVARAEAELATAKAALAYAKVVLERKKAGVAGNILAAEELDGASHEVTARELAVRTAAVAVGAAQDRLRYTRITAPLTGTVLRRTIEPGEVVVPGVQSTFDGKSLMTIANLDTLVLLVDLNQIDVAKARVGQRVTVTLDALPGKTYAATLTKIAPASVKQPGREVEVFPVEARLEAPDGLIKPGMTADVRIHLEEKPGVLTLPIEAVVKEKGKSFVTRIVAGDDGRETTTQAEVEVGARNDREVELVAGLDEGARVLVKPASAAANETKM